MVRLTGCLAPCAAALVLAPGAAADVIFVPNQAPTITAALAGAVDGDVIVIAKGTYHELVDIDDLGVSLVANGLPVRIDSITVRNLSAGKTVLLQKLEVGPIDSDAFEDHDGITCIANDGAIRIQQCTAEGDYGDAGDLFFSELAFDGGAGLSLLDCADVTSIHSTFRGGQGAPLDDEDVESHCTHGGPGISVRSSRLALYDADCTGALGGGVNDTTPATGGKGGAGLLNISGEVHAAGSSFVGGPGGWGDCDFLSGSCGDGGTGGDGIRQTTALASLTIRDNTYAPAAGGPAGGPGGLAGHPGQNVAVLAGTAQAFPAPHRVLHLNSPVFEGKPIQLIVEGQPGDLAMLHLGFAPGWLPTAAYQGVYQITPPAILVVLGVLTGPSLSLSSTAPELGPGIEHVAADAQLIIGAGSDVLLGGAKTLVLLNNP
jgi:hypothetical protein